MCALYPFLHCHFHLICVIRFFPQKTSVHISFVNGAITVNILQPSVDVGQAAPFLHQELNNDTKLEVTMESIIHQQGRKKVQKYQCRRRVTLTTCNFTDLCQLWPMSEKVMTTFACFFGLSVQPLNISNKCIFPLLSKKVIKCWW